MTRVNPEAVRARLTSMQTINEAALQQAVKDLGKDGAIQATDKALLDAFLPRMDASAKAKYAALTGASVDGASLANKTLGTRAEFAEVAAGTRVLEKDVSTGPAVRQLQEALIKLNYGNWAPTETFGPKTEQALKEFQVHYNEKLSGTVMPQQVQKLNVDGKLNKATLKAIDAELSAAPVGKKLEGLDKMDVVIDLNKNRAYVNAALVDPAKLTELMAALDTEAKGANPKAMYVTLKSKASANGAAIDDYDAQPVKTEAELGMKDSDGEVRTFVSFPVGTGAIENGAPLTPTGTFVVGEKRKNREATQYSHPKGFNEDTQNPFGPRWMRLFRETPGGQPSYTAYGLHGTTGDATWMKKGDGDRDVSHGCVRFRNEDIIRVFQYLPMGARVKIVSNLGDGT